LVLNSLAPGGSLRGAVFEISGRERKSLAYILRFEFGIIAEEILAIRIE
jgi:hypothetical protein